MSTKTCTHYRCSYYDLGNVSPIGITNCKGTAWQLNCRLSCPYHNYAMGLNPSPNNPNGSYTNNT